MATLLRVLHWASRIVLAGIFIYSGYIKLQSPLQFAAAITGYKLVPDAFVLPLAEYLPWLEIALGVLLLSGWKVRYAALGASGLLLCFIAILTLTYFRGIDADCGCFGFGDKISPKTIARDGLILLPALYLAAEFRLKKYAANRAKQNVIV